MLKISQKKLLRISIMVDIYYNKTSKHVPYENNSELLIANMHQKANMLQLKFF